MHMNGRSARWLGILVVVSAWTVTGCATAPRTAASGEIAPVRLRNTQTGIHERCGIDLIREVVRANDLTWSERLFFGWSAPRDARRAVQDEERWRQQCVERFTQRGYEVVSTPPAR
jgi:hypothetical protein